MAADSASVSLCRCCSAACAARLHAPDAVPLRSRSRQVLSCLSPAAAVKLGSQLLPARLPAPAQEGKERLQAGGWCVPAEITIRPHVAASADLGSKAGCRLPECKERQLPTALPPPPHCGPNIVVLLRRLLPITVRGIYCEHSQVFQGDPSPLGRPGWSSLWKVQPWRACGWCGPNEDDQVVSGGHQLWPALGDVVLAWEVNSNAIQPRRACPL